MLIKVKVNPKDTLTEAPHEGSDPIGRRTFIKTTLSTAGSLMLMPNMLSAIVASRAFASDTAALTAIPQTSFTSLELAGGAGLSYIFAPFRSDGSSFAGSNTAVLGINSNTPFNGSFIKGLQVNMNDPFYQVIKRGGGITTSNARPGEDKELVPSNVVDQIMSCVSGTLFHSPSQDDFGGNPQSVMPALQAIRKGEITRTLRVGGQPGAAGIDGSSESDTVVFGGADPDDVFVERFGCPGDLGRECTRPVVPAYYPKSDGSLQDLVGSVAFANDLSIGVSDANLLQEAAKRIMKAQEGSFKSISGAKGFFETLFKSFSIMPERANFQAMIDKLSLNSSALSSVKSLFQNTDRLGTTDRKKIIAHAANARNMVGSVSIVEGGYDYHLAGGLADFDYPHQLLGRNVLLWAATHHALGREGFMHIFSDGSLSWSLADGEPRAVGDNGTIALVCVLHFKPGGNPAAMRPLNYFTAASGNAGEAASSTHLVGTSTALSGVAALVTYLKVSGLMSQEANINALLSMYGSRLGLDRAKLLSLVAA